MNTKTSIAVGLLAVFALVAGCGDSSVSSLDQTAGRFLATSPLPQPVSISEIAEADEVATSVQLVGRIHAGDNEPFAKGKANFMLSELPEPGHGEGDPEHADNCPFCKRRAEKAPKANVEFIDESGQLIATDSRDLFGVEKGDVVEVEGSAEFNEAMNLVTVKASKIYVRRN